MNGTLHISGGPKSRTPKPTIIHYACRDDNGSRKPRVCWTVERGRIHGELVTVCDLFCPLCQFRYLSPDCLLYSRPCGEMPDATTRESV